MQIFLLSAVALWALLWLLFVLFVLFVPLWEAASVVEGASVSWLKGQPEPRVQVPGRKNRQGGWETSEEDGE